MEMHLFTEVEWLYAKIDRSFCIATQVSILSLRFQKFVIQVNTNVYQTVLGQQFEYTVACFLHGCVGHGDGDDLYDDTWAFDTETKQWMMIITNTSTMMDENGTNTTTSVPEGRIDAAGGVWGNVLWLSMGRNKRGRTLSDLWILNITKYNDSGDMMLLGKIINFKKLNCLQYFNLCTYFILTTTLVHP